MDSLVLHKLTDGINNEIYEVDDFGEDLNLMSSVNEIITLDAYARVSTTKDEQIDAVKYQKSVLEKWLENQCKIHSNWRVGKVYVDTKTGRNFNRTAYQEMMENAKLGKTNYIIFWETSRFGRNLSAVLRECIRLKDVYGVDLYFIDKKIDTRTYDGLGRLAEEAKKADEQSLATRNRVNRGIKEKRRILESVGDGYLFTHRVLGLESKKGYKQQLFRVEDEVDTLNMMADYYLEHHSLRATALYLTEQGRLTATGGKYWDASSVLRTLRNPIYTCIEVQDKTKILTMENYYSTSRTKIPNDKRKFVYMPDRIERIWSDEYFLEIQSVLDKGHRGFSQKERMCASNEDAFCKVLWCGCGGRYNKQSRTKKYGTNCFECHHKKNRGRRKFVEDAGLDLNEVCEMPSIADWKMDLMLDKIIEKFGYNYNDIIEKALEIINQNWEEDNDNLLSSVEAINKKVNNITKKIDNHRNKMMRDIISRSDKLDLDALRTDMSEANKEFIVSLIDMIVQVAPYEFAWHLNLNSGNTTELEENSLEAPTFIPKEFRIVYKKRLPLRQVEVVKDSRNLMLDFSISESEARIYKKVNNLGHLKSYNRLHVKVYCSR